MLGADCYETDAEIAFLLAEGRVTIGIGENTKVKDCIIDKNARIGKNVVIANSEVCSFKYLTLKDKDDTDKTDDLLY
ncbi:hypothetical protein Vadar_013348 [Vaccinium darrowii]|uniref:Uncharacterized protein n=1 Tax=Vaccinium darrowii TaxID=229202 RepID=A0ACB7YLB9_9ERIC|nr:hypothetical protein Vadar_013348 [Vaccinium darrowii]